LIIFLNFEISKINSISYRWNIEYSIGIFHKLFDDYYIEKRKEIKKENNLRLK